MRAEIAAFRDSIGLQPKKRAQGLRLDGFSKSETQFISEVAERGIHEVMLFCFGRQPMPGYVVKTAQKSTPQFKPLTKERLQISMRRFVAIAWLLHSELLVGKDGIPLSLAQLGKLPQLNCTKVALSLLAGQFGKRFNFQSRVQKRRGTKSNYSAAAKSGWDKRRAGIAAKRAKRIKGRKK